MSSTTTIFSSDGSKNNLEVIQILGLGFAITITILSVAFIAYKRDTLKSLLQKNRTNFVVETKSRENLQTEPSIAPTSSNVQKVQYAEMAMNLKFPPYVPKSTDESSTNDKSNTLSLTVSSTITINKLMISKILHLIFIYI